jgi:hypothetical protein
MILLTATREMIPFLAARIMTSSLAVKATISSSEIAAMIQ